MPPTDRRLSVGIRVRLLGAPAKASVGLITLPAIEVRFTPR
jgi:hypothetical protein